MQDRRAFLGQSLALAAVLTSLAPGRHRAAAASPPADQAGGLPSTTLPADIAALDVRPLGGGAFLVSGWVLTAADLAGLGVDPEVVSGATGLVHRAL